MWDEESWDAPVQKGAESSARTEGCYGEITLDVRELDRKEGNWVWLPLSKPGLGCVCAQATEAMHYYTRVKSSSKRALDMWGAAVAVDEKLPPSEMLKSIQKARGASDTAVGARKTFENLFNNVLESVITSRQVNAPTWLLSLPLYYRSSTDTIAIKPPPAHIPSPRSPEHLLSLKPLYTILKTLRSGILGLLNGTHVTGRTEEMILRIKEVICGKFGGYERCPVIWLYHVLTWILQPAVYPFQGKQDMNEVVALMDLLLTGRSPPCTMEIHGLPEEVAVGQSVHLTVDIKDGYGRTVTPEFEFHVCDASTGGVVADVGQGPYSFKHTGEFFLVARVTEWDEVAAKVLKEPVWCSTKVFNVLPGAPESFIISPMSFQTDTRVPRPTVVAIDSYDNELPASVVEVRGRSIVDSKITTTGQHSLRVAVRKMGSIPWDVTVYGPPVGIFLTTSHLFKSIHEVTATIVDNEGNTCTNSYEGWWVQLIGIEGWGAVQGGRAVFRISCTCHTRITAVISKVKPVCRQGSPFKSQLSSFKITPNEEQGIVELQLATDGYISPADGVDITLENTDTKEALPVELFGHDPSLPVCVLGEALPSLLLPAPGSYTITVAVGAVKSSVQVACTEVANERPLASNPVTLDPVLNAVALQITSTNAAAEVTESGGLVHHIEGITVQAVDVNGRKVASCDARVSIDMDTSGISKVRMSSSPPELSGTTSAQLVNGAATFPTLIVRQAAWPLVLQVTSSVEGIAPCSTAITSDTPPPRPSFTLRVSHTVAGDDAEVYITTNGNTANIKPQTMEVLQRGFPEFRLNGKTVVKGGGVIPAGVAVKAVDGNEVLDYTVRSEITKAATQKTEEGLSREYAVVFETSVADTLRCSLQVRNYETDEVVKDKFDVLLNETTFRTSARVSCLQILGADDKRQTTFRSNYLLKESGWMYYVLESQGCDPAVSCPFYVAPGPAVGIKTEPPIEKLMAGNRINVRLMVADSRGNAVPFERDISVAVVVVKDDIPVSSPVNTTLEKGVGQVEVVVPPAGDYSLKATCAGFESQPVAITSHASPAEGLRFKVLHGTEEIGKIPVSVTMVDRFAMPVRAEQEEKVVVNDQQAAISRGSAHAVVHLDVSTTVIEGETDSGLKGYLEIPPHRDQFIASPKEMLKVVKFRLNGLVRLQAMSCIQSESDKAVFALSRPGFVDPCAQPPVEAPHSYLKRVFGHATRGSTGAYPQTPLVFGAVKVAKQPTLSEVEADHETALPVLKARDAHWAVHGEVLLSWAVTAANVPPPTLLQDQAAKVKGSPMTSTLDSRSPVRRSPAKKSAKEAQTAYKRKFAQPGILITLHGLINMLPIQRPDETRNIFCKVAMGGEWYVTEPCEDIQRVNRSFCFVKRKASQVLKIMVYAKKKITKSDQFLGEAFINTCTALEEGEVSQGVYVLGPRAAGRQAASDLAVLKAAQRQEFGEVKVSWMPFSSSKILDRYLAARAVRNVTIGTAREPHPRLINAVDSETVYRKLVVKIHEFEENGRSVLSLGPLTDELKLALHALLKQMKLEVVIYSDASNVYWMTSMSDYLTMHNLPCTDPVFCCVLCSEIFISHSFHFCSQREQDREPTTVTRRLWCLEAVRAPDKPLHFIGFSSP
eukprot:TRINITY_DN109_c0_g3_i1.p1 TRINITY_DN109_c0_g3~~TRINITY_DN109_c0_g3_i1.p1  ORF type:complete len:1634 (+),score=450.95 TRINITY_DN109_c0_g3_i1:27-4904(+)